MKNKGFTLIELLGVIVILALLMVLVMPKIINSLKSSNEKVDDLTLEMIYNAADLYVDEYEADFLRINGRQYCIPLIDLTEEEYLKNPININSTDITNLKTVQATYNDGFKYELKNNDECDEILSVCELTKDNNNDGVINTGDEITCGTESFYVIPDHDNAESGTISMLAKYNLNVGSYLAPGVQRIQNQQATGSTNLGNLETGEGYSENINCYDYDSENGVCNFYGAIPFSTSVYWNTSAASGTFVYNDQSLLSTHINYYKEELERMGAGNITVTLPTYNQLINLGCSATDELCTGEEWVFSSSYWTGSKESDNYIYVVLSLGTEVSYGSFGINNSDEGSHFGVRPVVIIPEDEIR